MATFGFLSTLPPTKCGLATFTDALADAMTTSSDTAFGVRVVDGLTFDRATPGHLEVTATLLSGSSVSVDDAADALNAADVVVIQHEYGIYGGEDGDQVVDVMRRLTVPTIAVLHTVLDRPHPHQKAVLEEVVRGANVAVVMTHAGRARLRDTYDCDMSRVHVIPHGVAPLAPGPARESSTPVVLTWGLIGPGKGIERALDAMADLADMRPRPNYLVVGQTHPKVRAREGEAYRMRMQRRARTLRLDGVVQFEGAYLDARALAAHVRAASVVLLPYDSTSQITSGVLAEAVAAGVPVVATAFPHAVELLSTGAGIVVPHDDRRAMSDAVRHILSHPEEARRMSEIGTAWGRRAGWQAVGARYREIAHGLVPAVAA